MKVGTKSILLLLLLFISLLPQVTEAQQDDKYTILCKTLQSVGYQGGDGDCSVALRVFMYLHRLAGIDETRCIHPNMTYSEQVRISNKLKAYLDTDYENIMCEGELGYTAFLERIVDLDYQQAAYDLVHFYHTIDFTVYRSKNGQNILEYIDSELEDVEEYWSDNQEMIDFESKRLICFRNIFLGKYKESGAGPECTKCD